MSTINPIVKIEKNIVALSSLIGNKNIEPIIGIIKSKISIKLKRLLITLKYYFLKFMLNLRVVPSPSPLKKGLGEGSS